MQQTGPETLLGFGDIPLLAGTIGAIAGTGQGLGAIAPQRSLAPMPAGDLSRYSASVGHLDMRAQPEVISALRSDTPTYQTRDAIRSM
jgi:hypothetical protein